jgi:tripartite-type tricarboxylate transporter receptor subunit TctC
MITIRARFAALLSALVPALLPALFPTVAGAQNWPAKPIRMIIPSGAGGAADLVIRLIGERLSPVLGQPIVYENRPGAGGHPGSELVARAPADGYTLLMSGSPTHSVGPHLYKKLNYDPMRDVPPVAMVGSSPNLLLVNASLPVNSVAEFVKYARDKPGQLNFSSAANGTSGHLAAELLKSMAKIDATHVPYKSGPEAVTGLLNGSVSFMFFTIPSTMPQVRAGKLKALGISSAARSPLAPGVPTVAESGYPGFEVLAWYGVFAPRGTPRDIVLKLAGEIEKIMQQPEVRERFAQLGTEPTFMGPDALTAFVAKDSARSAEIIKASGATAD